jgi:Fic family protein
LHPQTAASLADLVRVMNCYYSNLIEGHHTLPRDIERALANDLDGEDSRRNLQIEAWAHIRVQRMIDRLYTEGALPEPAPVDFIRWLHREFYADSPRRGDLDGHGNLSLQALVEFVEWFLRVCLDQVEFMAGLPERPGIIAFSQPCR